VFDGADRIDLYRCAASYVCGARRTIGRSPERPAMKYDVRFDETVTINLQLDEAIVLLAYLVREVWGRGSSRLEGTYDHPAETHGVQALLQELFNPLVYTGTERFRGIEDAARESVMHRYSDDDRSAD
jgi:hypothetical protein